MARRAKDYTYQEKLEAISHLHLNIKDIQVLINRGREMAKKYIDDINEEIVSNGKKPISDTEIQRFMFLQKEKLNLEKYQAELLRGIENEEKEIKINK